MLRSDKDKVLEKIRELINQYENYIFADYRGLTVTDISNIREKLRQHGVVFHVTKNRLIKIALEGKNITGLDEYFFGPTAILYAKNDIVKPFKLMIEFHDTKKIQVKGGFIQGKSTSIDGIKAISKLPSIEVLYSKLLGTMQAPLSGVMRCLNGPVANLTRCLEAVRKQKEEATNG